MENLMRVMDQRVSAACRGVLLAACAAVVLWSAKAAGQSNYTWHNVRIVAGGFVPGIVYHPNVQNLVYARTDIGGLYKSTDGGSNWAPLLDSVNWSNWGYSGVLSVGRAGGIVATLEFFEHHFAKTSPSGIPPVTHTLSRPQNYSTATAAATTAPAASF
jgi:photosystem II stability/assembly factor-like uncharacterized protein